MRQGTYMLLLDCTEWCRKHGITIDELQKRGVGVGGIWQEGSRFHSRCGIRMSLALPFALVDEAIDGLRKYVCGEKGIKYCSANEQIKGEGVVLWKIIRPMTGWKI